MKNVFLIILFSLYLFNIEAQTSMLIGTNNVNEYAYGICADNSGNTYFGSTSDDEAWVFKKNTNNQIIWSKKINTTSVEFFSDISYIDIVGDTVFGCGWLKAGSTIVGSLIFKLNATTGATYWIKSESSSSTYFSSMKYANGKFFVTGSQVNNSSGYNGKVIAVSSNNGALIWQSNAIGINFPGIGFDYIDDFYSTSEMVNGQMFITGRSYVDGSIDMRTILIGINDQGTIFLHKYLQFDIDEPTLNSRFYGISIEYDGLDSLIILQYGDDYCYGCSDNKASLIKTNLNGDVSWCKQYDLSSISLEVGRGLNVTPDSYVFYGYANLNGENSKMFAIKTAKDGSFQVAKLISFGIGNLGHISGPLNCGGSSNYKNGLHYIPGGYFSIDPSNRDIAQIILDENLEDPTGCFAIVPDSVTVTEFVPFSDEINVNLIPDDVSLNLNPTFSNSNFTLSCNQQISFSESTTCNESTILATVTNITNPIFNWSNGETTSSITVNSNDTLILSVINPLLCCTITDTIIPSIANLGFSLNLPNDTIICSNEIFTISATTISQNPNLTYLWNTNEQTSSINITQSGTYWVSVSNACTTLSDTINVAFGQNPTLTFSLNDTICNGNNTNIVLTSNPQINFSWYALNNIFTTGETTNSTNSNIINDNITNNSTSNQTVTYLISAINVSCFSTQEIQITIIPNLQAPIISSNGPLSVCEDGVVILTSNYSSGNNWSTNENVQSIFVSSVDTIDLFININECVSPTTSIIITQNPSPTPTIVINGGGEYCDGEAIEPISAIFSGTGPWSIEYNLNGQPQTPFSTSNPNEIISETSGNYEFTFLSDENCTILLDETLSIVINPIPTVTLNPIAICAGETGTLTAIPNIFGGIFEWIPSGETNSSISISPSSDTVIGVIYTLNGCSVTSTADITVLPPPISTFTIDTLKGCIPLSVQLTSDAGNQCEWTLSNGQSLSGCNPTYTFVEVGCFEVSLQTTSNNGCTSTTTSSNAICVDASPDAYFISNPNTINAENTTLNFINLSSGADSYIWNFGDGSYSSSLNPSHSFELNESGYSVHLSAFSELGCQSEYTIFISYEEDLIFYVPNCFTPDGNSLNQVFNPVFTSGFDPFSYNLKIFDRWGEIIFESNDTNVGWDGTYIQTPNLVQDGIYVWKISFKLKNNDDRREYSGHVNIIR